MNTSKWEYSQLKEENRKLVDGFGAEIAKNFGERFGQTNKDGMNYNFAQKSGTELFIQLCRWYAKQETE